MSMKNFLLSQKKIKKINGPAPSSARGEDIMEESDFKDLIVKKDMIENLCLRDWAKTIVCEHEAAHAVMRWIRGYRATKLTVNKWGGICYGTGKKIRTDDCIWIAIAGLAWECRYGKNFVGQDFREAKKLIKKMGTLNLEKEFKQRIYWAYELLSDYSELIKRIGKRLKESGELSSHIIAGMIAVENPLPQKSGD